MFSREDFLGALQGRGENAMQQELRRRFTPFLRSGTVPAYACVNCSETMRGPCCPHCGHRQPPASSGPIAWPVDREE